MGSSSAGARESASSGVAAGAAGSSGAGAAKPATVRVADVASKGAAAPDSDRVKTPLSNDASQAVVTERSVTGDGRGLASASTPESRMGLAASSDEGVVVEPEPAQTAEVIDNTAASLPLESDSRDAVEAKADTLIGGREAAADVGGVDTANAEGGVAGVSSASTVIPAGPDLPEPTDLSAAPQPFADTPSAIADVNESAIPASEPDANPASLAAAHHELQNAPLQIGRKTRLCRWLKKAHRHVRRAALAQRSMCCAAPACGYRQIAVYALLNLCANLWPRRPRLPCRFRCHVDLLLRRIEARRRQRAIPGSAVTTRARTVVTQAAAVPLPVKHRRNPSVEEMQLDDYQPVSSEEGYFIPPDDGFMPAFDSGPDDLRFNDAPAAKPALKVDARPLPPAVPLDAIGVSGDWPSLAVDLPLKGIAYQLAFNSELTACDAASITLTVPVPQYAESAQVAKLKAALTDKLGRPLEVSVSVGPARRTACRSTLLLARSASSRQSRRSRRTRSCSH